MAKRILVDMSATLIHHGHIRLIRRAAAYGDVIVGLATDDEIREHKGYLPELKFEFRREIVEALRDVKEVLPAPWMINDDYLIRNNIDFLLHGHDNSNKVDPARLIICERTVGVSSSSIRKRAVEILLGGNEHV